MKHAARTYSTFAPDLRVRGIGSTSGANCAVAIMRNGSLLTPVQTGGEGNFATL